MYDELVKELRHIDEFATETNRPTSGIFREAADAIETLEHHVFLADLACKAEAAKAPRWIPVSERLPEEDGCYLVAVKNDHKRRYSKTAWFSNGAWFARQDVTHWMPMPKEPKEE